MSEILKNTASQSVFVTVIDSSTGAGKESGVSFTYTAAGGSQAALTNTPTHKGNGQYEVIPTQAETNVDCFSIGWYGSGVVPNCVTIYTTTKRLRDLQDLAAGAAMTLTAAYDKAKDDVLTPLAVVDGLIDTLISRLTETRAGYLDAAISSRGTLTAGQVRTELATELARILKGLPDAIPGENGGLPTTNGTKVNQTVDTTATANQAIRAEIDAQSSQLATLTGRLSAARAGYMDKLNVSGILAHTDNANSFKATGFSTHSAADVKTAMEAAGGILALMWADLINGGRLDLLIDAIKAQCDKMTFNESNEIAASASVALSPDDVEDIANAVIDGGVAKESTVELANMALDDLASDMAVVKAKAVQLTFTTPNKVDASAGDAGAGAITHTYTVQDGSGNAIPDVRVSVYSNAACTVMVARGTTNNFGQVTFYLDAGTYYMVCQKAGYIFTNPDTEVVA